MSEAKTSRPTIENERDLLGAYYPVLDKGFVALMDYMGTDSTVPTCARTSYGHGTKATSNDKGLVRYLRGHKHTSPFEFVEFHFHCSMPIFVARQWVRHRTASINEVSGRYSILPMLFHTPEAEHFAKQSQSNKQGRGEEAGVLLHTEAAARWSTQRARVQENYEWLIGEDVARELARIDLPLSTYTQWRWKIDGHNLMHFLGLRCDPHAQWEIRVFANIIAGILERGWPNLFEAWADYNFKSRTFSRQEMQVLCQLLEKSDAGLFAKESPIVKYQVLSEQMVGLGMSKREVDEFLAAFDASKYDKAHFELPEPKPFEYFMQDAQAAVPKIDVNHG
jgi:thymidylate synthase (FAD)